MPKNVTDLGNADSSPMLLRVYEQSTEAWSISVAARISKLYLHITPMANQAKALRTKINHLQAELETCATAAQRRCVKESIIAAERQLTELG